MGMLSTSLIAFAIAIATLNIPARYFAIMLIPSSAGELPSPSEIMLTRLSGAANLSRQDDQHSHR